MAMTDKNSMNSYRNLFNPNLDANVASNVTTNENIGQLKETTPNVVQLSAEINDSLLNMTDNEKLISNQVEEASLPVLNLRMEDFDEALKLDSDRFEDLIKTESGLSNIIKILVKQRESLRHESQELKSRINRRELRKQVLNQKINEIRNNRMKKHGNHNKVIFAKSVNDFAKAKKAVLERLRSSDQVISRNDLGQDCFECKDDATINALVNGYLLDFDSN